MKMRFSMTIVILISVTIWNTAAFGQNVPNKIVAGIPVNYSEDSVGTYTLPDPLVMMNGKTVLWTGARDARFGMVIACCGSPGFK